MNKKTLFIVLICILFGIQGLYAQEFTWQIAVVKADRQGVQLDDTVDMESGERFSINVWADKSCFVYMVVEMASGSMAPIFNQRIPAKQVSQTRPITLKSSSDNPQQERFYIVASLEEQKDLQLAINQYNSEKNKENANLLKTILFEVSDPVTVGLGRSVDFAGAIRGEKPPLASEYSGSSVYAKTIIIRH